MASGDFLKKFQTKDWIYLFIISIFLQFIIYYFSFIYGGSTKALGYVSFAGTLISIILAIIAIGYTYGESIKQKGSSDQLLLEIANLRDIKDKLAGQVDLLENIAEIKSAIQNTESAVRSIDFSKYINQLQEIHVLGAVKAAPPEIANEQIEKIIMSFEYITDLHIFKILQKIVKEGLVSVEEFIPTIVKDHNGSSQAWLDCANLYTAIYFICISLGIISDGKVPPEILNIYEKKYPTSRVYEKGRGDLDSMIDSILYEKN